MCTYINQVYLLAYLRGPDVIQTYFEYDLLHMGGDLPYELVYTVGIDQLMRMNFVPA